MPYFHGDTQLHYLDQGKSWESQYQPVILLHGLGSRASDWQPQLDALAPCYRVVAPDLPGHGESDALTQPTTMQALAKIVIALLDHLKITKAHIVGLSLGGMIALQLAVDHPERVDSMVIINSAPGLGGERNIKIRLRLLSRKILMHLMPLSKLAQIIGKKLFPLDSQQALREQFLESMAAVDKYSYQQTVAAIGKFDLGQEITGCTIPTLVLASDNDYTSIAFKQSYVDRLPNAHLQVIANSRHAAPLDSPEICNREILKFLDSL